MASTPPEYPHAPLPIQAEDGTARHGGDFRSVRNLGTRHDCKRGTRWTAGILWDSWLGADVDSGASIGGKHLGILDRRSGVWALKVTPARTQD